MDKWINLLKKIIPIIFVLMFVSTGIAFSQTTDDITVFIPIVSVGRDGYIPSGDGDWSMVAGNPERTSWSPEEVIGNLQIEWYKPIEAYIPQNSQIIASNGLLYISTSKGLYALNATSGALEWRYDTELPLGNSPTVVDDVLYVGGYDRKLHALNALTGAHLWSFDEAKAGYDTNPLVIDGRVFVGNRDGYMYAVGAHGTPNQGRRLWKFKTGGAIHLSSAYKDGVVYFASNDNYAYALEAATGALVWKSDKLPGMQYQSYWPVIYRDKVIFVTAYGYRQGLAPGTKSVLDDDGKPYGSYGLMRRYDLWPEQIEGTTLGPEVPPQPWTNGFPLIDASRMTEYLEDNPTPDAHKYKPWRRTFVVLERDSGEEYTFDSDLDGYPEYFPAGWWGTGSGNRYPPIVGPDNILYFGNTYLCCSDAKGRVMGWQPETPSLLSVLGGFAALAEPQALSIGGETIYRNLCCDRVGAYFSTTNSGPGAQGELWSYDLHLLAPDYDPMWGNIPSWPRLQGWYNGNGSSVNAAYHNHGDQNPIIPYNGRLYVHRSNTIFAFGPDGGAEKLPMLTANNVQDSVYQPTLDELTHRLEEEIEKILDAGHLRPGYYNVSQFQGAGLEDYFSNPGDTLYTLSWAYPHLSSQLQNEVRVYLQQEFETYFDPNMYIDIGWADGAPREAMELPPDVEVDLVNHPPALQGPGFLNMFYLQHNFYAMWKYAQIVPSDAVSIYNLAKTKLQVPMPDPPIVDYFKQYPYELNAWIAGYTGFLELQELAGMDGVDSQLRTNVTNELNRLLQLRVDIFSKDSYWVDDLYHKKHLDVAGNFIFLTPELGEYMRQHILPNVQVAVDEYEAVAPYWFVSRYEASLGEGVMSNLYNYNALFLAKAFILGESRSELTNYLDVPAFERGDLLYIQNLITAIEAPDS